MTNEHTKTPWTVSPLSNDTNAAIEGPDGLILQTIGDTPHKANAAFVVRACNSHDELLYCLKSIINDLPSNRDWLNPDIERMARTLIKEG